MITKITKDEQERLEVQSDLKKLITGLYLKDTMNENFLYIKDKFFNGEANDLEAVRKTKLLNVGSGLFTTVTETIAKYVGNPSVEFYLPTKELVRDYLTYNYATFELVREKGKLKVQYSPAEGYFERGNVHNVVRFYTQKNESAGLDQFYLLTSYTGGIIENKLFQIVAKDVSDINFAEEVPLDRIEKTSQVQAYIDTGLEQVFFVIRQSKLDGDLSLVEKIRDLVYSIDRKEAMFETQYLQHGEAFLLFPGMNAPKGFNENSKLRDLKRIIFTENEGADIRYVRNENPLLKDAKGQELAQLEKISGITGIPLDFLGANERVGSIGEDSRAMLHGNFVKTITNIRQLFDGVIYGVISILSKEDIHLDKLYVWEDIVVKSDLAKAEEVGLLFGQHSLISRKTALKIQYNYSDEEYEEEMKMLEKELEFEAKRASLLSRSKTKGTKGQVSLITTEEIQMIDDIEIHSRVKTGEELKIEEKEHKLKNEVIAKEEIEEDTQKIKDLEEILKK